MFAKHQKLIGSLVVGLALAIVGCGDGNRQGNRGNNKRMLRNPAFPGSTNVTPVNGKVAGKDQSVPGGAASPATGGGANLPVADSKDEKQIDARFDQLTKAASELPKLPAGSYDLAYQVTIAKLTFVKGGFANALAESQFANGERKELAGLSSGTLDQAVEPRSIGYAMALDVDAAGKVTAPAGAEFLIDSKVESKSSKPVLIDVLSPASNIAPASISLLRLLNDPGRSTKDADGKTATLRILPQADGSLVLWIAIEELAVNASGSQGNTFNRNFFFNFVKATEQAPAAQGAQGPLN